GDAPVDGRMGFLNWPGRYREFRNLPELPLIGDPLLCPGLLNDRQRFLIALAVFPPWYAKPVKVLGIGPAPHAGDGARTDENIEHGEVFCLAEGVLQGEYAEGRAEAQAGGCLRHGGQKELWARTDAKGIEMLLARPDRIEAELFSVNHELKGVFVVGDLSLAIGEKVKQGKQAELHRCSSFCSQFALADLLIVMIWVFVPRCFGAIPSCGDTEPLL